MRKRRFDIGIRVRHYPGMGDKDANRPSEFEQARSEKGLAGEFWEFLKQNRKFWMVPIIVVLLALGGLLIAGGSSLAPFIYALF